MKTNNPPTDRSVLARISIWTIIHHDFLAGRIRIYLWSASATVLFLSLAGVIPITAALTILLICGCIMLMLLWSLINWRRSILLGIQDQELKEEAYAAMLALIRTKQHTGGALPRRVDLLHR